METVLAILPAIAALASTAASVFSSNQANKAAKENAQRQENVQREFAQQGIQWKVEDAKRAGIHPIYALGAQTTSYSPVSVGQSTPDFSGLKDAGQSIQQSIDKTRTVPQRQAAVLQTAAAAAQLDGLKLDNEIKRADLASKLATNATRGPAFPQTGNTSNAFNGQGDAIKIDGPKIKVETDRDVTDPGSPAHVPGSGPGTILFRNNTGGYSPARAPALAESMEDDWLGGLDWAIRNRIMPNFGYGDKPKIPKKPYEEVYFSNWTQDWRTRPHGTGTLMTNPGSRHWRK